MSQISSITRVGTSEPFELQVARGQVAWHYPLNKFGYNSAITDTEETIWSEGGIYSYITSHATLYVSSSVAADAGAGTGARTLEVQGLDADYNLKTEVVTLNGQTQVALSGTWMRVFRAFVTLAGSGGTAAGTIYIGDSGATGGVPDNNVYANLSSGNQTQLALWTVPAGHTFYLDRVSFTAALSSANAYMTTKFNIRIFETNVFRTILIDTLQSGELRFDIAYPIAIPEKTDIECRAVSSSASATAAVSASFEGVYLWNGNN